MYTQLSRNHLAWAYYDQAHMSLIQIYDIDRYQSGEIVVVKL